MAPPSKKRRVHHKSRRGCQQCKERHIKCDEQLPSCANCTVTNRTCSYNQLCSRDENVQCIDPKSVLPPSETCSASVPSPDTNSSDLSARDVPQQVFDLSHLALFHHLETGLMKDPHISLVVDEADMPRFVDMIITAGLSMPYLMDEVLAFAALHLGILTSDVAKQNRYRHQAVELQTRALALYHAANPEITEENCTALCVFSSFVGMHMLYDTITGTTDLLELLDKFIQFAGLYRGVGIVVENRWHVIRTSELGGIVGLIEAADEVPFQPGGVCDHLLSLLEAAKDRLGPSALEACEKAVETLQWTFHQHSVLQSPINRHIVFAWPVRISAEYLDMLRSRQPEALVIMAYWGLLLHREQDFWIFGKGGQSLIEAVQNYLGAYWDNWIIPLREYINADSNLKT